METQTVEDVPSTAIALLRNPDPLGPSGDNSSTIANISQQWHPHSNTRLNNGFASIHANWLSYGAPAHCPDGGNISPHTDEDDKPPLEKCLTFKLIHQPQERPLRVTIHPHDCTESIVSTVRNFFGLGKSTDRLTVGVSLEDDQANTLIASWDNLKDGGIIYVRVFERLEPLSPTHGDEPGQPSVGPSSGVSRLRGPSPNGLRGRRSTPAATLGKRSPSRSTKTPDSGSQDGYSSGDGAPASSSSRTKDRSRATGISVKNIVEGSRRQHPKFSSDVSTLFGVIAHCAWLVADSCSSPGASPVCPTANTRRRV